MSSDVFNDALRAEGLDDAAIARIEATLREHDLTVGLNFLATERRAKREEKERREAAHAGALALALPYVGKIKDCQASVTGTGRGATSHRCQKPAKFVVRRKEFAHRDDKDSPLVYGDGRLAVCTIHARDDHARRYWKHWDYEVSADEVVEPEYQPPEE